MPGLMLRVRVAREDGFTMIVAMMVLLVVMLFSAGAYQAVIADSGPANRNADQKLAFAAADAGLQWYQASLASDPNFWTKCANIPQLTDMPAGRSPIRDRPWTRSLPSDVDPRNWRTVPGSTEQYTVEMLPFGSAAFCDPTATSSMLDPATRTFRIRISGRARTPAPGCGQAGAVACPPVRSIIGTFRRRSFLDYLYYTNYETLDPKFQTFGWGYPAATSPTVDPVQWSAANCNKHYWQGRETTTYPSPAASATLKYDGTNYTVSNLKCAPLQFLGTDSVAGPLHSEDSLTLCSQPIFGRNAQDPIEVANGDSADYPSWLAANPNNCPTPSPATDFKPLGTPNLQAPTLPMPTSNSALQNVAGKTYNGPTTIVLNGSTMTVTNGGSTTNNVAVPGNGVIYVNTNGACSGYKPTDPYSTSGNTGCGDLTISGHYSVPLTFGAADDIVIRDDLTNDNANSVLGLVAQNFVRVYHNLSSPPATFKSQAGNTAPVKLGGTPSPCTDSNAAGTKTGAFTIKAAILALNDSFVLDNFACGAALGTTQATGLTVVGAIAQNYRGPVSTGGSNVTHGYTKNYTYDDRLHSRTPPQFLDPAQASWNVARVTEQVPATG